MDYFKFILPGDSSQQEIYIALLAKLPFDTFQEQTEHLEAYVAKEKWNVTFENELKGILEQFDGTYERMEIPHQNWNQVWESSFEPILIPGKCLVRAEFHASHPNIPHEIVIQPQMAFGTGHHATTYLVMEQSFNIDFIDKKVLDYGCGTGILAILASKLGAITIDAIDNDPLSTENTTDNLIINEITNVQTYLGTLEKLVDNRYDVILANINRNVLLGSANTLFQQLSTNGILLVSGLLDQDESVILKQYEASGFRLDQIFRKNGWICIQFQKA